MIRTISRRKLLRAGSGVMADGLEPKVINIIRDRKPTAGLNEKDASLIKLLLQFPIGPLFGKVIRRTIFLVNER